MNGDTRLGPSWGDPLSCVFGVIAVAVDIDPDSCRLGDVDGFGCSLLRAQPAAEDGAIASCRRPFDEFRRHAGREDRVDRDDPAPRVCLEPGYAGHRWGGVALRRVTKLGGDRLLRGQVERVHDRGVQRRGERDRRRVEGVIVDNVVSVLTHSGVDARERRVDGGELAIGGAGRPVERGTQRLGVDPGIDHRNARYLRSGGGVEVDLVTSVEEPARQVGHEGL
jgi:hypothetical protein